MDRYFEGPRGSGVQGFGLRVQGKRYWGSRGGLKVYPEHPIDSLEVHHRFPPPRAACFLPLPGPEKSVQDPQLHPGVFL